MNLTKPTATARKKEKKQRRQKAAKLEDSNKGQVRRRDKSCRFPLCGCRRLGLALKAAPEVSHSKHKGAGGNPNGERSAAILMVLLCRHRHQDGAVSIHKGTLRARFLSPLKFGGPIAWQVDADVLRPGSYRCVDRENRWVEIARETAVQQWEPFTIKQSAILFALAEMNL